MFFSFHYDDDVWRANQVQNANVVAGADMAGFFDHSEYAEAKKKGSEGISRMILNNLRNTSVTVVLIGNQTANRPWVRYEIERSIAQNNGLLGIYIHQLKNHQGITSWRGSIPSVPRVVEFPTYDWDKNLDRFRKEIEAAGKRSDALRRSYY